MVTFENIKIANEQIKTTDIKGKDYAEVNQRIKAFRMVYPQGGIVTHMLSNDGEPKNHICIFRAIVTDEEGRELGVGTAYESENGSFINKTSYIENCETSAVGRALGMAGFGIDTSICSAEELQNALLNQGKKNEEPTMENIPDDLKPEPSTEYRDKVYQYCLDNGITHKELARDYKLDKHTTEKRFKEVWEHLNK